MNYYAHHIGDYAQATSHLSILEDGVYSRLLRKYYANEEPLPADVAVIARHIGARTPEERSALDAVLQDFFCLRDDGWHQARCDAEIELFRSKQAGKVDSRENARLRQQRSREHRATIFKRLRELGHVPQFSATTAELTELVAKLGYSESSALHDSTKTAEHPVTRDDCTVTGDAPPVTYAVTASPKTNHHTPETKSQVGVHLPVNVDVPDSTGVLQESTASLSAGFIEFWEAWPKSNRKGARGKCAELWAKYRLDAIAAQIVAHVRAKADHTDWTENNGKYVEAPLVYLNQRSWEGAELAPARAITPSVPTTGRHSGLYHLDHKKGISDDGTLA